MSSNPKVTVTLDGWSSAWQEAGRRMLACEQRMFDRDNEVLTGTIGWLDDFTRRYSKHVFPRGVG